MTVNKNNCWLFRLTVLLFLGIACSGAHAQLKRNVLHIRFQKVVIHPTTTDTTVDTYYWIESYSPFTFTGFDFDFNYENTKCAPEGASFFGNNQGHGTPNHANFSFDVQVDNAPQSIDTSSPILFRIRYLVIPGLIKDSAMITPNRFYAGGFDSITIDNTTYDPVFQWHSFGILFADTTKPQPPKKVNITLSSDSTSIDSNSVKTISIRTSPIDSANVETGSFAFDFDTLAFDSVTVLPGALIAADSLKITRSSDHISAGFTQQDSLYGQGELFKIVLRGRKRTDTLCTEILNPKFTATNDDARINTVNYKLQGVCVLGKKDTVITKGIVAENGAGSGFEMYPNPARSFIDFVLPRGQELKRSCEVFDMLGRKVLDVIPGTSFRWNVGQVPAGIYTVEVSDLAKGSSIERGKILIIH